MADLDTRLKRQSASNLLLPFTIPGVYPSGSGIVQAEMQAVSGMYSGILAVTAQLPDTFFNVDPNLRPADGDVFYNNISGDVWFDVLNAVTPLSTSWDILNDVTSTTMWHVWGKMICLRHFYVREINFGIGTKTGSIIVSPEQWETFCIKNNVPFTFQLIQPIDFTHYLAAPLKADDC